MSSLEELPGDKWNILVTKWIVENDGSNPIGNSQAMYVRDCLHKLLAGYDECKEYPALVINMHRSKSIDLPVYGIEVPSKELMLIMRCNFYNWIVSVNSLNPIGDVFGKYLFRRDTDVSPSHAEGFDSEWVHGRFEPGAKRFTVEIPASLVFPKFGDGLIFTFIYLLAEDLRG